MRSLKIKFLSWRSRDLFTVIYTFSFPKSTSDLFYQLHWLLEQIDFPSCASQNFFSTTPFHSLIFSRQTILYCYCLNFSPWSVGRWSPDCPQGILTPFVQQKSKSIIWICMAHMSTSYVRYKQSFIYTNGFLRQSLQLSSGKKILDTCIQIILADEKWRFESILSFSAATVGEKSFVLNA